MLISESGFGEVQRRRGGGRDGSLMPDLVLVVRRMKIRRFQGGSIAAEFGGQNEKGVEIGSMT